MKCKQEFPCEVREEAEGTESGCKEGLQGHGSNHVGSKHLWVMHVCVRRSGGGN